MEHLELKETDPETVKLDEPEQETEDDDDPWNVAELKDRGKPWSELTAWERIFRVSISWVLKPAFLVGFIYLFVCSLSFLGSAFQLLGGKRAGEAFSNNDVVRNPIAGLMIGILGTVLLQSSSTTTSIVVAMVSSGILSVERAIPVVMGANIGTSVTNTIVSLGHAKERNEFRRAFAGATVHDMFNFLAVLVLLPLELASKYLFHLSKALVDSFNLKEGSMTKKDLLKKITKPLTKKIVELDKKLINKIATGEEDSSQSLIKVYCYKYSVNVNKTVPVVLNGNETLGSYKVWVDGVTTPVEMKYTNSFCEPTCINATWLIQTTEKLKMECDFLFHKTSLSDSEVGVILLIVALVILCVCLVAIVKILHSLLRGRLAFIIKKTINADFPGRLAFLTGYLAIVVGAGATMLVQSSSIFTSAITPLVGVGVITLERTYPLTLGANIGTTITGILAALASTGNLHNALQIAMCHLFFNISGILIWYPIPKMRQVPISMAKTLGNTIAKYRWFSVLYLFLVFFIIPAAIFALSLAGWYVLAAVGIPICLLVIFVIIVNVLQSYKPTWLPKKLQTWEFLPLWMHSLEPMDRALIPIRMRLKSVFRCSRRTDEKGSEKVNEVIPNMTRKEVSGVTFV
jgi:sodium-dependent phosphate cotransporter